MDSFILRAGLLLLVLGAASPGAWLTAQRSMAARASLTTAASKATIEGEGASSKATIEGEGASSKATIEGEGSN